MFDLIDKLHRLINLAKDFEACYDSRTANDGKMLVEYKGKRYFVKIEEVENPSENIFNDMDILRYF